MTPSVAQANGGTVRTNRATAGPYAVTVFTSPTPLVVGIADVSVSVERADTGDLEPDARIIVTAEPLGHPGHRAVFEAEAGEAGSSRRIASSGG